MVPQSVVFFSRVCDPAPPFTDPLPQKSDPAPASTDPTDPVTAVAVTGLNSLNSGNFVKATKYARPTRETCKVNHRSGLQQLTVSRGRVGGCGGLTLR